jgi:hypothetical protein
VWRGSLALGSALGPQNIEVGVETTTGLVGVETTTGILFFQPLESMPQSRSLNSGAYCAAGVRNHEHLFMTIYLRIAKFVI